MSDTCSSSTCTRRGTCARNDPELSQSADYSNGWLFSSDHCFWFKPLVSRLPVRQRVGTVYGGRGLI